MYMYMYMYMRNKTVSAAVLVYSGIDSLYIMCLQRVNIMKCMCTCNSWYVILKVKSFLDGFNFGK